MKWNLSRAGILVAALSLAGVVASACGSGGDGGSKTPTAPATTVDLSKDDLGRSVTLPSSPKRIVAMSPTIVELMFEVGATPVGRPSSADYPEAAKAIPAFGTSYEPNTELIVAMKPDLIIADAIIHQSQMETLTKLGVPVFAVRAGSFDEVVKGLRVVGALTGNKEAGEKAAKALEEKLAGILAKKPATSPTVLVIVGAGPTQIFAAKNDSYVGDVVRKLGGVNPITTEPENFRFPGFADYSLERILEKNPDIIIAISPGPASAPKTSDSLARSPVWSTLKAVKEGRVYEVDPVVYVQSAGPRLSLILDELPRILYPDVFKAAR